MTISFRQDFFDGRCLTILTQGIGSSTPSEGSVGSSNGSENDIPDENTWKRVLYEDNRAFPDNYTPDTFLSSLSINMDLTKYEYIPSVISTIKAVSIHLSLIPCFFVTFYFLRIHRLSPFYLICIDLAIVILGYVAREIVVRHLLNVFVQPFGTFNTPRGRSTVSDSFIPNASPMNSRSVSGIIPIQYRSDRWSLMEDLRRAFLVFGSIYILSPLLRTLTRSWSEDTIIAIAVTMLIVHLAFHDYTFISRGKSTLEQWHQARGEVDRVKRAWKKVDHSPALNAIIFSAIVLASRLNSFESVFGFIFFSIAGFAFLPFVLKCVNLIFPNVFLYAVCPLCVSVTAAMLQVYVGYIVMFIFLAVLAVVMFVCPYILVRALSLKKAIKGPWDIAHVKRKTVPTTPIGNASFRIQ